MKITLESRYRGVGSTLENIMSESRPGFYAVEGVEDVSTTQLRGVEIMRSLCVDAKIN